MHDLALNQPLAKEENFTVEFAIALFYFLKQKKFLWFSISFFSFFFFSQREDNMGMMKDKWEFPAWTLTLSVGVGLILNFIFIILFSLLIAVIPVKEPKLSLSMTN